MQHLRHCLSACALLAGGMALVLAQRTTGAPPNIVLIVADDLGYGDLGCYGSAINKTPHIDRLAREGLKFTDFHSSGPMCSATRAGMLTGLYQQRFGPQFDGALSGTAGTAGEGLPLAAVTVAEILKKQGYATAAFGKWHLGYAPPLTPVNQGFDEFRGLLSGDGDHHTHVDRSGHPDWWHNDELAPDDGYTATLLTEYSVDFIQRHRDTPFFLYVPHLAIHFPWQGAADPPHRQAGTAYHDDKWGIIPDRANVQPHVTAMISALDESVGRIMAALHEAGVAENTLVIFTSDNGGYLHYSGDFHNISSNGPLRGQKTELYEGGHRVPALFYWPGRIRAGKTAAIGHSTDLLPTFAALAGVSMDGVATDGVDLTPHLFEGEPVPDRMLFLRKDAAAAVRSGAWKLVRQGESVELFDLESDLGESKNLAVAYPEKVEALTAAWKQWEAAMNRSAEAHHP